MKYCPKCEYPLVKEGDMIWCPACGYVIESDEIDKHPFNEDIMRKGMCYTCGKPKNRPQHMETILT